MTTDTAESFLHRTCLLYTSQRILEENGIAANTPGVEAECLKDTLSDMLELLKGNIEQQLGAFDYAELYQDLYGHLKSSLGLSLKIRGEENFTVIYEVKENYPAFYRAAVVCGEFLERKLDCLLYTSVPVSHSCTVILTASGWIRYTCESSFPSASAASVCRCV